MGKNYSPANGYFRYHASCLQKVVNDSRGSMSSSIWKSAAFTELMDIDIEQRVIQQGYCIDISNLKRIFMQYLIDAEMVP